MKGLKNKIKLETKNSFDNDVRRDFSKRNKDTRIHIVNFLNIEFMNKYNKHVIDPDFIWFDINRDEIITLLNHEDKYDIYLISKRGRIKIYRNKELLKVIALRFRYYKKYLVIAKVNVSQPEDAALVPGNENEVQTE